MYTHRLSDRVFFSNVPYEISEEQLIELRGPWHLTF